MLNIQFGSSEFNLPYALTKTIGEVSYNIHIQVNYQDLTHHTQHAQTMMKADMCKATQVDASQSREKQNF